jgi:hypothetical protein
MQFEGEQLLAILNTSCEIAVEIHNAAGRVVGTVALKTALVLAASGQYVGVGNKRRIHYLRPLTQIYALNRGSQTTVRMSDSGGLAVGGPWVREHKVVPKTAALPHRPSETREGTASTEPRVHLR